MQVTYKVNKKNRFYYYQISIVIFQGINLSDMNIMQVIYYNLEKREIIIY